MAKLLAKATKVKEQEKATMKKRGFEGGQQPLQRRLPKVGFASKFEKPYVINVEKIAAIKELAEISIATIASVHKISKSVTKIKLIGASAKALASKIKDENVALANKIMDKTLTTRF